MSAEEETNSHRFKIVVLGDTGVGKTSLIVRFVRDAFRKFEATTGGTFYHKNLKLEDSLVKFHIWDTSGEERFRSVAPLYYRGAAAAIVVYDVTSYPTLVGAKSWIEELHSLQQTTTIVLVGNKVDLQPSKTTVTFCEAEYFCSENDLLHIGTSAKNSKNVQALFHRIAQELATPPVCDYQEMEEHEEDDDDTDTSPLTTSTHDDVDSITIIQRLGLALCCLKRKRNGGQQQQQQQ